MARARVGRAWGWGAATDHPSQSSRFLLTEGEDLTKAKVLSLEQMLFASPLESLLKYQ